MTQRMVIASAALGALRLIVSLLGAGLPGLVGVPGASGAINFLWVGGFTALAPLITRRFGSATIAATVYSILALPLPLSGPSGFLPKVIIGLSTGLAADLVFLIPSRSHLVSSLLMGAAAQSALGIEFAYLGIAFQVPGIDKYANFQLSWIGIVSTLLGGAFSGFLGWLAFRRIEDSPVVERIREKEEERS